ncbi:MAG TPA: SOS response-associated peptidase family protein [Ignavibacteriales bacterium]|nr:SOS response-associated peptidase family protein [Ignavibacteriales bacterium]HOL80614.1 SOS response-associated peptidase family protein [Ignavibacteriales bacterium]HOM64302.1 SOS response-associated peptidase family protein [Ignavibacteriales bacterium]HPD68038.1 SOS response-associated peptidase family protein [Ignavibacteriales bacterium]HPP33052.1 SOS response-associated peptidase family protein [Ignavibacteriales bacterium]
MCCRICILTTQEELELYFKKQFFDNYSLPNYNISPTQKVPIIIFENSNNFYLANWGITTDKHLIFNSRIETLLEKKLEYKKCIVAATGFYEWKKVNNYKQPYFIKNKNEKFTIFAGIYKKVKNNFHFSIITQNPPDFFLEIHNRIPLILSFEDINYWLNENNIINSYNGIISHNKQYVDLHLEEVSSKVNNSNYNSPDIFTKDEIQLDLFS